MTGEEGDDAARRALRGADGAIFAGYLTLIFLLVAVEEWGSPLAIALAVISAVVMGAFTIEWVYNTKWRLTLR